MRPRGGVRNPAHRGVAGLRFALTVPGGTPRANPRPLLARHSISRALGLRGFLVGSCQNRYFGTLWLRGLRGSGRFILDAP